MHTFEDPCDPDSVSNLCNGPKIPTILLLEVFLLRVGLEEELQEPLRDEEET